MWDSSNVEEDQGEEVSTMEEKCRQQNGKMTPLFQYYDIDANILSQTYFN